MSIIRWYRAHTAARHAAIIAALSLIVMAVLAPIANFWVLAVMRGIRPLETSANLLAEPQRFQFGVWCFIAVLILDVVVALALYRVFAVATRFWSAVAAGLRLGYALFFGVAVSRLFLLMLEVNRLPAESEPNTAFILSVADRFGAFDTWWDIGLLFFGAHLLVLGAILARSRKLPTWLAVLAVIAGAGYLIDSLLVLVIGGDGFELSVWIFLGEVAFILWLLLRGGRTHGAAAVSAPLQ